MPTVERRTYLIVQNAEVVSFSGEDSDIALDLNRYRTGSIGSLVFVDAPLPCAVQIYSVAIVNLLSLAALWTFDFHQVPKQTFFSPCWIHHRRTLSRDVRLYRFSSRRKRSRSSSTFFN